VLEHFALEDSSLLGCQALSNVCRHQREGLKHRTHFVCTKIGVYTILYYDIKG